MIWRWRWKSPKTATNNNKQLWATNNRLTGRLEVPVEHSTSFDFRGKRLLLGLFLVFPKGQESWSVLKLRTHILTIYLAWPNEWQNKQDWFLQLAISLPSDVTCLHVSTAATTNPPALPTPRNHQRPEMQPGRSTSWIVWVSSVKPQTASHQKQFYLSGEFATRMGKWNPSPPTASFDSVRFLELWHVGIPRGSTCTHINVHSEPTSLPHGCWGYWQLKQLWESANNTF